MPVTSTLLDQAHNAFERKLFAMKGFHHPGGSQQAFLIGLAHLYNLVPYQRRAKHGRPCGVEVEGGTLPTDDWFLNLQILTSGGFQRAPDTLHHEIRWNVGMPRTSKARIHQKLWPTNGPPIHPLFVRTLHHGGPALSATPAARKPSQDSFLEGQIDGDVFRYDHVCTPCPMGTVVFSHTSSCPGVLKTLTVIAGHPPVRSGAGGLAGKRGNETCMALLAILYLTEGQKSSSDLARSDRDDRRIRVSSPWGYAPSCLISASPGNKLTVPFDS
jgi:hypothetical protein